MKEFTKAVLVSLLFFIFFFALGAYNFTNFGEVNGGNDFAFHWATIHDLSLNPDYPHFYHYVFEFFGQNKLAFYTENLLLICLIIPFLIFYATKTWWSSLIYFMGVSLPHMWLYGATYPQAFAFMFLIIYLCKRKDPLVFAICAVCASLVHREGSYLFAIVLIAEVIDFLYQKYVIRWAKLWIMPSKQKLLSFSAITVLGVKKLDGIVQYLTYLIVQISPVIWFYSRKIFFQPFWLVLAVVPLFLLNYDTRIISLTQLALLFVATPEIVKSKHKKTIIIFLLIQLAYFLLVFSGWTITLLKG